MAVDEEQEGVGGGWGWSQFEESLFARATQVGAARFLCATNSTPCFVPAPCLAGCSGLLLWHHIPPMYHDEMVQPQGEIVVLMAWSNWSNFCHAQVYGYDPCAIARLMGAPGSGTGRTCAEVGGVGAHL